MSSVGFGFEGITLEVGDAFGRMAPRLQLGSVIDYFSALGTTFPPALIGNGAFVSALSAAQTTAGVAGEASAQLRAAIDADAPSAAVTGLAVVTAGSAVAGLGNLVTLGDTLLGEAANVGLPAAQVVNFATGLGRRVLDYELCTWLEANATALASVLTFLGVLERTVDFGNSADPSRPPVMRRGLNLDLIAKAVANPLGLLGERFGLGAPGFGNPAGPANLNGRGFLEALGGALRLESSYVQILPADGIPELDADAAHVAIDGTTSPGVVRASLNVEVPDGVTLDVPLSSIWSVHVDNTGTWPFGLEFRVDGGKLVALPDTGTFSARLGVDLVADGGGTPIILFGTATGTRIELGIGSAGFLLEFVEDVAEPAISLSTTGGRFVLDVSQGDGLIRSLVGASAIEAAFDLVATYSATRGLVFSGGSGLKLALPIHTSVGGLDLQALSLAVPVDSATSALPIVLGVTLHGQLGPFGLTVQDLGFVTSFAFDAPDPNLGIVQVDFGLSPPIGLGVSIDGGGISGGGFLSRDPLTGRYTGAIELRAFAIGIKAFGVVDTVFPDGSDGFSFVVVISAEFTPIQLGLGFTLLGVGGLLGINRTVDEQALGNAVRTGSLEHLLFPTNVVQDAPAIINDLATVFPAAPDHHLFGPMAKFGWGTPTLISADLGVIIEFPGPRLALLGVIRMQLPSAEFPIMNLNLAVGGLLDFPAGKFSIDASLFDSRVAGYTVSGDMAFRLEIGEKPTFLMSVGGFNGGFKPPAGFPKLRRCAVDLGVSGNPSLTATGYFALTSNTAQIGAGIDARAHGYGIDLRGHLGFDVLFVFSPFSFTANIDASVSVELAGIDASVGLHGSLSGPTPWHLKARACVDVVVDEACLPIDKVFGREEPAALPEMDPWVGSPADDPRIQVLGLGTAVNDKRNWSGEEPLDGYRVVSLTESATATGQPIDPVGPATLRQRVCPLEQELERFGEYKPIVNTKFSITTASLTGKSLPFEFVDDLFAPSNFLNKNKHDRLSGPSYDTMTSGIRLDPARVAAGPSASRTVEFETVFVNAEGDRIEEGPLDPRFILTQIQLQAMLLRCASAVAGIRKSGTQKYMLPGRPKLVTLAPQQFVVVDACSMVPNPDITPTEVTHTKALLLLRVHEVTHPEDRNRYRVAPALAA